MMYDLKTVAAKQAHELAVLVRLTPEAMTAEMRSVVRTKHHREVIAANVAARFPALAPEVCALVSAGEGSAALDRISECIEALHAEDPFLFEGIPSREEMMRLAIAVLHDGRATEQDRRSIWPSFCDRSEEHRLRDGYKFRHEIAARGEKAPSSLRVAATPIDRNREGYEGPRSGRIDGGPGARARVASALDATAFDEDEVENAEDAARIEEGSDALKQEPEGEALTREHAA